jgi:putative salt-induced outer membrane protein
MAMIKTLLSILATLGMSASLLAGNIVLSNGDIITGEIVGLRDGKLRVRTDWAGVIDLDFSMVQSATAESELLIEFLSGQRVEAAFSVREEAVEVHLPEPITVIRAELISATAPPEPVRDPRFYQNWRGGADFGFDVSRGNSDLTSLSLTFSPHRRTPKDRVRGLVQSRRSVEEGRTQSDSHRLSLRYDRFVRPQFFFFVLGEAARDGRELLDYRTRQGVGVGYTWMVSRRTHYSLFGGVTYTQEKYLNLRCQQASEGLLAVETETNFFDRLAFQTKTQILPRLSEGRYLVDFDAGIRLPVYGGVTFGLRFYDNYDSSPTSRAKRNDFGLLSTVGFSF